MTDRFSTLRNGLVGAWCPSAGASGRRIVDRSPYRNDATLTGSFVWRGDSIDLTAASTYGEIASQPQYDLTTRGFSISAWFTLTTLSIGFADVIIIKEQVPAPYFPWALRGNTGSNLHFVVSSTTTNFEATATTTNLGLTTNRWFHVAGTFDGQLARLWINGRLGATSSAFTGTPLNNTLPVRISDSYAYTGRQWPGLLDDIRMWNRGLTQSEVGLLAANRGKGLLPTRHRRATVPPASTTQMSVRVGGSWLPATPYVNVAGTWRTATPYTRQGGVWK